MRTTKLSLVAAIARPSFAACTVKDVDMPALSGPSSLARTIDHDCGPRHARFRTAARKPAIRITAQVQPGQSENVRLRAQVFVDGVAQDFGTLSNKNPITPHDDFLPRAGGADHARRPGADHRHDRGDAGRLRRLPRRVRRAQSISG